MHNPIIVVFGEALVDVFKHDIVVGGAPFNVARHLAGFALNPLFISAIGRDEYGELIQQEIKRFNMHTQGVQIQPDARTGQVVVHENDDGHGLVHQFEIMSDCAYDTIAATPALTCVHEHLSTAKNNKFIYHGTLALRSDISRNTFERIINTEDATIFLDLNWRAGHVSRQIALQKLSAAHVVKVSIEELLMVLEWLNIPSVINSHLPLSQQTVAPIRLLMSNFQAKLLLVTYGHLGSAAFNSAGVCLASAQAIAQPSIIDTVGAGDAFSSVMLLALAQDWSLNLALTRANQFAADICKMRGAVPRDVDFYQSYRAQWQLA